MEKLEPLCRKLVAKPFHLSFLLVAVALYYSSVAFSREGAENTRVSEHALMPGIVLPTFDKEVQQTRWLRELNKKTDMPSRCEYISNEMNIFGLDSQVRIWRKTTIFKNSSGLTTVSRLRAYRSTGAEAMIIGVRMEDTQAVALAMALAHHARGQSFWSRDIYFLFIEGGAEGMDAWLEEYYGVTQEDDDKMEQRGRFVVGAVVIETPSHLAREGVIDVRVQGMNGQLPNLDLFNTIVRIAHRGRNQMHVMIYPEDDVRFNLDLPLVPARFLLSQAVSGVEGIHSVFSKYGVQALTIRGPHTRTKESLGRLDYLIEGVMRSMNNLHERFHQSYFLYVLVSPNSFSSIAFYLPIVAFFAVPILAFALREWISLPSSSALSPSPSLLMVGVYGGASYLGIGPMVERMGVDEDGMTRLIIGSLLFPLGLFIRISSPRSSRFIVLISIALALGGLALVNFALALAASIFILPAVMVAMVGVRTGTGRLIRTLAVALFNPLAVILMGKLTMVSMQYQWWSHTDGKVVEWALTKGAPEFLLTTVFRMIDEHYTLGSWHLPLLLIGAGPIWNSLLAIASTVDEEVVEEKEEEKEKKE